VSLLDTSGGCMHRALADWLEHDSESASKSAWRWRQSANSSRARSFRENLAKTQCLQRIALDYPDSCGIQLLMPKIRALRLTCTR
jgi:hypothetical protein